MSIEVEYFGDCRDEASFGKPWTDAEIERIRVLQSMRLKYRGEKLPMHPATYADGRMLATVDALAARAERAERDVVDLTDKARIAIARCASLATALGDAVGRLRSVVDEVRPHVHDGEDARNLREGEAFLSKCNALLDAAGGKGGGA